MLVVVAAVGGLAAVGASIRCVDAARELARLAARGEPDRGLEIATRLAPRGAEMQVTVVADDVTVEVSSAVLGPLPLRVSGFAVAALEPGAVLGPVTGPSPGAGPNPEVAPNPEVGP